MKNNNNKQNIEWLSIMSGVGPRRPEGTGDQFTACFSKAEIKYERKKPHKQNKTKQNNNHKACLVKQK